MAKVTDVVAQLATPVVEQAGCSLWDVEYVKVPLQSLFAPNPRKMLWI